MSGGKANRGSFQPGQSGNPGGRPATLEVSALARRYTADWLRALVDVVRMPVVTKNANAIVAAARVLADVGYPGHAKASPDTPQSVLHMHLLAVSQDARKLLAASQAADEGVWGESGTEDSADSSPLLDLRTLPRPDGRLPHEALPLWDAADETPEGGHEEAPGEAPEGGGRDG